MCLTWSLCVHLKLLFRGSTFSEYQFGYVYQVIILNPLLEVVSLQSPCGCCATNHFYIHIHTCDFLSMFSTWLWWDSQPAIYSSGPGLYKMCMLYWFEWHLITMGPSVNSVCYSGSSLIHGTLQFSKYNRLYAVMVNVFCPYHIKASVLPFLLHWLWFIFLANFVECCSDPPVWLLPTCLPTCHLEVVMFSTLFAIWRALFQHVPCCTVFALFHIFVF